MTKRIEGDGPNPDGYCLCGCGRKTKIAKTTNARLGHIRGRPLAFIWGHNNRTHIPRYSVQDRGYETPCWIWKGRIDLRGYGRIRTDELAHRVVYEQQVGPIPERHDLDHLCEIRRCVNPKHLVPRTRAEHKRRHSKVMTYEKAEEVRAATGSQREVAARFGISQGLVWKIKHRLAWAS